MTNPPSPFLPGTSIQFAWDSTSLGYLKTCPRLYQYIMIEGWAPKDENIHLRFGIEYHTAIEDFHRYMAEGYEYEDALRLVIRELVERTHGWEVDEANKPGKYKNRKSISALVIAYLDKWKGKDPAKTHILDNGKPAVELSFRFELPFGPESAPLEQTHVGEQAWKQPYLLCGHLDQVVEYADGKFVMDHKTTTTTLSGYYFDQYEPNNQMTLYTLAAKTLFDVPIRGVIIDAAQILLEKPHHFERGFTYRTQDQLDEWVYDLEYLLAEAEGYALANYWPMRDTSCDKYGGCRFRPICAKSRHVREKFLASSFTKQPLEERWNPLKPR